MKKSVVLLAGLLIAVISIAQNQKMDAIHVTPPTFRCELFKSINDLLTNGVQYPAESKNAGLQGTEVIRFTVTVDGKLSDFHVVNSVSAEIDQEVIRVLQVSNGKWTPGMVNGNRVDMGKEVFVVFKLKPSENFVAQAKSCLEKANEMLFVKNNPEKAMKYYNRGITLLPDEKTLLSMRALCNYKLGNEVEASSDWERIAGNSTNSIINEYPEEAASFEKYEELSQKLQR